MPGDITKPGIYHGQENTLSKLWAGLSDSWKSQSIFTLKSLGILSRRRRSKLDKIINGIH